MEFGKLLAVIFDPVEKGGIFDEGDLDGFNDAGAALGFGLAVNEGEVVDHGVGDGEGAEKVFFAVGVDSVFDSHSAVVLCQSGGGESNEPDSTVGGGCGKSNDIQVGAAADTEDVGVTINASFFNDIPRGLKGGFVAFAGFSSGLDDGAFGVEARHTVEVGADLVFEIRKSLSYAAVDKCDHLGVTIGFEEIDKHAVLHRKGIAGESDAVGVADADIEVFTLHGG